MGIAKTLINQFDHSMGTAAIYTHNTRIAENLAQRFGFVYSPYVALTGSYRKKAERQRKKQDAEVIERAAEALIKEQKND
jgi:ABC-type multidrug transport system ATPase subunit